MKSIRIPSTLREIKANTFRECTHLRSVEFSEGLAKIGSYAFSGSGIESFVAPVSLSVICQGSFCECQKLVSVTLNEGLEELGTDDQKMESGAFEASALENIELPSTLKKIQDNTFKGCHNLKTV